MPKRLTVSGNDVINESGGGAIRGFFDSVESENAYLKDQPATKRASQYADNPDAAGTQSDPYENGIQAAIDTTDVGDAVIIDGIFEVDSPITHGNCVKLWGLGMGDPSAGAGDPAHKSLIRVSNDFPDGGTLLTFNTDDGFLWQTEVCDLSLWCEHPDGSGGAHTGITVEGTTEVAADILIRNCAINKTSSGTGTQKAIESLNVSHSLRIEGCMIEQHSEFGVWFDGGQNMTVKDTYFTGNATQDIHVESGGTTIKAGHSYEFSGNTHDETGAISVSVSRGSARIHDNHFEGPGAEAVDVSGTSEPVIVSNNVIVDAGADYSMSAIELRNSPAGVTISENIIDSPDQYGMTVDSGTADLVVTGNQVRSPGVGAWDINTTDYVSAGNNPSA